MTASESAKISMLNLSDSDVMSLDGFGSETGLSEILQDTPIAGSNNQHRISPKPSLSVETAEAVLTWRNDQDRQDATPKDVCSMNRLMASYILNEYEGPCQSTPSRVPNH